MHDKSERRRPADNTWHKIEAIRGVFEAGIRYMYIRWDDGKMTRHQIKNSGDIVLSASQQEFVTEWPWAS